MVYFFNSFQSLPETEVQPAMPKTVLVFVMLGLVLSACAAAIQTPPVDPKTPVPLGILVTPTTTEPVLNEATSEVELVPAMQAARVDLANILGVAPEGVIVNRVAPAQWSDSCLGLGGPAEICAQMLIDGFQVELQAIGALFTYRTNQDGSQVRIVYPEEADAQMPVQLAQVILAGLLGLNETAQVRVVQALPVVWQDACLGSSTPGKICAEVVTPGFRILLQAPGGLYEFHTNQDGSQIVQVETP